MTHTPRLLLVACMLASVALVHAQTITPQPEPGLWRSHATTLVDGRDAQADIRKQQEAVLEQLPPEQRAQLEATLESEEDLRTTTDCITAEDAALMINPQALLAEAQQSMSGCDLQVEQDGESRLAFHGTCSGDHGFVGDMQGALEMISSREMRSSFSGRSNHSVTSPGDEPVLIEHTEVSKWVSADCDARNTPAQGGSAE